MVKLCSREIKKFYNKNHKRKVTLTQFNAILKAYLEMKLHNLVINAKREDFFGLGTIEITRVPRPENSNNRSAVNWGLSNKIKANIIKEGGTPLEYWHDKNGELKDNGGKAWKVKYDRDDEPFYLRTTFRMYKWLINKDHIYRFYSFFTGRPFRRALKEFIGTGEEKRKKILQYNEY